MYAVTIRKIPYEDDNVINLTKLSRHWIVIDLWDDWSNIFNQGQNNQELWLV